MIKKLIASLMVFFSGCDLAIAQNVPANPLQPQQSDIIYVIDNFSPMLNSHTSPYSLTHGEATDAYNVRGNDEYSALAKRPALNTYGTCSHSSPVTGLTRFYQSNGNKYTVTSSGTYLDYISDSGSCTNLLSGLSTGARWNFQTYKNTLIATDGFDWPQKWDGVTQTTADTAGSRSASYLTAQLGAPFAQLATGSGLTASKWYHYVIAYWDGTNYWYSNAQSNPIQMGASASKQVSLTGIPLGPATTQARYLFRTKADNSAALSQADTTYYFLTAINDNITTTYTDSISDASITTASGAIQSYTVYGIGADYTKGDVLTVSQAGGSSGTATVTAIYSTGSGATLTYTVSGGVINAITSVAAGGTGYAVNDVLTVLGGNGDARIKVTGVSNGAVTTVSINAGGTGYIAGTGVSTSDSGTVTSVSFTTGGSGYTNAIGVATTGGSGTGATLTITTTPSWSIATTNNNSVYGGLNVTPPHGLYPYINGSYFWLANDPSGVQYGQSTAYFSSVGDPDYFLATNYFLVRPDDGDAITFINSYLGALTIGKTNSISKIYTQASSPSSWSISPSFSNIGCISPYSAIVTPVGIIYLGRYGLYGFNGQASSLISDVVTNDINDIAQFNLSNVASTTYKNEYRMAYTSSSSGAATNNRVLVYDMIRNSYVKDTENINVWSVFNSSSDYGGLYSGSSNTDGYILANSTQPTQLVQKLLTDLNAGTFSYTGATGTQTQPVLSLVSSAWSADSSAWNSESTSTWQADQSPGTWISPIFQINANSLYELYWNSNLPAGTSATIAIRTGSTTGAVNAASWSSEFSNPAGSNISGVSANTYIQMRVTLTSSNLAITPSLYVQDNYMINLVYSQVGTAYETSVPSTYTTGWLDLVTSPYMFYMSNIPKTIKEIDVYYEGSVGTMNFNLQNLKGDSVANFNIDMSQNPPIPQSYWGGISNTTPGMLSSYKMYRWLPGLNDNNTISTSNPPSGDKFLLSLSESGTGNWRIQRIAIRYDLNSYRPYANQ